MARILRRPQAQLDATELWAYINRNSGPEPADALIDAIERIFLLLADHPLMGRQRDELRPACAATPSDATWSSMSRWKTVST
jgi:plasmid stabilization system protein ParE